MSARALLRLALLVVPASVFAAPAELLLIIDDIGNNRTLGERAIDLPGPLNLAFLPHTPFAARLAESAWRNGHGIMLHAPMANDHGARLGPGALTQDMDKTTLQQTLLDDIQAIPHVQGLNNHMGSLLTRQPDAMQWVMETARNEGLFFIDSLTSPQSVALKTAGKAGIPALERDVFLDNSTGEEALRGQYDQALKLARSHGHAVLIGHPYPETLAFLSRELPLLEAQGIRLTRIDDYLQRRIWLRMATPAAIPPSRYLLNTAAPAVQP